MILYYSFYPSLSANKSKGSQIDGFPLIFDNQRDTSLMLCYLACYDPNRG